jgi:hypothetical protein
MHGSVAVGAVPVEVVENRIVVDALEEFVDGAEAGRNEAWTSGVWTEDGPGAGKASAC